MEGATFILCSVCNEEWMPDAFRAGGTAFANRKRICGACYEERYPRRYVACTGCGRKMSTRGKRCAPMCRPCRRHRAEPSAPPPPELCIRCGAPLAGRAAHSDGRCFQCYAREWRAEHGVNGKQTIGAWEQAA